MKQYRFFLFLIFVLGAFRAFSQSAEPEVRRALPMDAATNVTPVPVRRAEPVVVPYDSRVPQRSTGPHSSWTGQAPQHGTPSRAVPDTSPLAKPSIPPVGTPFSVLHPQPAVSAVPTASPTANTGSIRMAPVRTESIPHNPGEAALATADGLYSQKLYDVAATEYERASRFTLSAVDRSRALFRLGECYRFLGDSLRARQTYERLDASGGTGEFVGAGAFRLAEIFYNEQSYARAAELFRKAALNSAEAAVVRASQYYEASSLEGLKKTDDALVLFRRLAEDTHPENTFRESALMRVAEADVAAGKKLEAMATFELLVTLTFDSKKKAEMLLRAAVLAVELDQRAHAEALFEKAFQETGAGEGKGIAVLGMLQLAYQAKDYKKVASISNDRLQVLSKDALREALVLVGNAQRQIGQYQQALQTYDRVLKEDGNGGFAKQIRFQRLLCLAALRDARLVSEIDAFLTADPDASERLEAMLLKAEALANKQAFDEAATLYAAALEGELPERFREQAAFKLAWCHYQQKAWSAALQSLDSFIQGYPQSAYLPTALTYRGLVHQTEKAYDAALADYDRVISDFPKAKERELALEQKALILGQQVKSEEMVSAFEQLLKDYPKSKAAAKAHYWIGWAAFEGKAYAKAIPSLQEARNLDPKGFGERATLRLILARYYLQDADGVTGELSKIGIASVPHEVLTWLGRRAFESGEHAKVEKFLAPVADGNSSSSSDQDLLLMLAKARVALKKFTLARTTLDSYVRGARDPVGRASGLLLLASMAMDQKNLDEGKKLAEEVMLLQPEGNLNAEARLLLGQGLLARGDFVEAAKAFETVAILIDDPEITPRALRSAVQAYRKAGKMVDADKAEQELKRRFRDKLSVAQ